MRCENNKLLQDVNIIGINLLVSIKKGFLNSKNDVRKNFPLNERNK